MGSFSRLKQIAQNYRTGALKLLEVPVPLCRPGGVVVRSEYSLISAGTELMKIEESRLSLLGKARARPDQVRTVLETASQQGLAATYRKAMNRLDSYTPLGYSVAGTVVESRVDALPVGTRVACGGNEYALHSEFNYVPKNLCAVVPDKVDGKHAAFATVGAIALHAFRQSEAAVGELVCVIGLGLIGQLLLQVTRAAGVTTIGIDPSDSRCLLAEQLGADVAGAPSGSGLQQVEARVRELSHGAGADAVFLAAATSSEQPVMLAVELARDRARIVDIGKLPLNLPWKHYYEKEIEVRFSRSYGPGRYDPAYEELGVDYPIGYVRWTEQRNMEAFLQLVASERVDIDPLINATIPFDQAVATYEQLASESSNGVGSLFAYPQDSTLKREITLLSPKDRSSLYGERVRLGVIGAGNYANSMLLPHLADRDDVTFSAVATASALSGKTAQERFGFDKLSTDYRSVLSDEEIDAVLIATRHDLHASMVAEALEAGKAVFVEKPLAISQDELMKLLEVIERVGAPRLMVGFNRRFAPLLAWMRRSWGTSKVTPQHVHYTVNAGSLVGNSWQADAKRYGSRFVGEGGHFIDTISWWLAEDPVEVFAYASADDPDNLEVSLRYASGSLGHISYLTRGSHHFQKETMLVSGGRRTARMDNFRKATIWGVKGRPTSRRASRGIDKGQSSEIDAFVDAVRTGAPMPNALSSLLVTTQATLLAQESARHRQPVTLDRFRVS